MKTKARHAPWWQLWMLVPVLGILEFLETGAPLSAAAHKVVEIGIMLLINGLIWLWLRVNKGGLLCVSRGGLAQTGDETALHTRSLPDIIAGSNDYGHRQPMWYVHTQELDVIDLTARRELDR
jgi:hypothetical protein